LLWPNFRRLSYSLGHGTLSSTTSTTTSPKVFTSIEILITDYGMGERQYFMEISAVFCALKELDHEAEVDYDENLGRTSLAIF
jgi:hypothetical protein